MCFSENKRFCAVISLCVFSCLLGPLQGVCLLRLVCFVSGLCVPLGSPVEHWFALRDSGDPGRGHCYGERDSNFIPYA